MNKLWQYKEEKHQLFGLALHALSMEDNNARPYSSAMVVKTLLKMFCCSGPVKQHNTFDMKQLLFGAKHQLSALIVAC